MRSGRKSSRSKTTGPAAIGAGRREPQGGDGVGQLRRGVRRLRLVGLELAPHLEHEQAVDVSPELGAA